MGAVAAAALAAAACGKEGDAKASAGPPTVNLGPENLFVAQTQELRSGPPISGTLAAEREATVRAEVSGTLLETMADKGQRVSQGAVLARIEDSSLRESMISAQSAVQSAQSGLDVARRNAERAARLVQAGAVAERDLEAARNQEEMARSSLAAARARLAEVEKQAARTRVQAPLTGVVSDRPANAGDVVQPGTALFTIVDPGSMRLEASVPAAQLGQVRVGAPVRFRVSGYPGRTFTGTVQRINPAADPATRQVPVLVTIPNAEGALVGGLFAEGRVESESRQGLALPATAVDERGVSPAVLRVKGGRVERVPVQLGTRDSESDRVEVLSGLAPGDTVLVGGALGTPPGTRVQVRPAGAAPAQP
jgi:RND family efflux transporter MFP subunit